MGMKPLTLHRILMFPKNWLDNWFDFGRFSSKFRQVLPEFSANLHANGWVPLIEKTKPSKGMYLNLLNGHQQAVKFGILGFIIMIIISIATTILEIIHNINSNIS